MYPQPLENLITELKKMPGVGRRSAERIAFYILKMPPEEMLKLISSIQRAKKGLFYCRICNSLSEKEVCSICDNPNRSSTTVCIVENPQDMEAIERTGVYKGLYYVLGGAISPLKGITPQDLKIEKLFSLLRSGKVREVIIATNFTPEGENTALFLNQRIRELNLRIKITRLSLGIPLGSSLEYLDETTVAKAIELRR
ncbi:MAG: recombination protein RecR [Candidatus Omnitrophota bacterium]|nr:MAG: recombination protein RecR [Candidatus Omnitrophota bacterium]